MLMDTPAPDIPSSGTSSVIKELHSNLALSQTTAQEVNTPNKTSRRAKKKAKKREKKKDKKKFRNEFNKSVKKLIEDGHVPGSESVVGDVTPGQINEPESSTVIWSPALARSSNASMGIEDNEHVHEFLHSFLLGRSDDDNGPPLMKLGGNTQLHPLPRQHLLDHNPAQDSLQGDHVRNLVNVAESTTVTDDSVQIRDDTTSNIRASSATPTAPSSQDLEGPGQDHGGDEDDPHPTAKESSMAGGVDSNVKESSMAGGVDSTVKESSMAGGVDSTVKESSMARGVDSIMKESDMTANTNFTIKEIDADSATGEGEDSKQGITIHIHHPPRPADKNKTLSLKRKWKKSCKKDYYNRPQGRQCCLRAVRCFDHLPEILEEIDSYDDTQANKLLVCSHVRSSLTCMSTALKQKQCRSTAKDINEKFKPQLTVINRFFDPHCVNIGQETTTPSARGEGHQGSGGDSHVNAGIIGASVGGFILIGILVLICLFIKRRMPKRSQSKKTSRDNDMNNKRESSRYKDMEFNQVQRQHSDVYAEIDERSMNSFRNPEMNGYLEPDGVRPLPSAPPNGTIPEDQQGYLTPQIRKDSVPVPEEASGGYTVLQSAEDGTVSYTTLRPAEPDDDADYISPDEDAASPKRRSVPGSQVGKSQPIPKPRQPSTGEEPYHAYFILEKENIEHV
ncbi:uncharacterized protein LOC132550988 [Ylistrum balloti]|uniref:uncharacterized protein LOC132550988 n=1 Tax=Ylistrum balloti TaxID=509963 RepID=UPI002905B457|nr:uncharacterized protein LOC132550988 [Ylistrum balloti]